MALAAVLAALLATSAFAATTPTKRAAAYYNPADHGGSMLTRVENSSLGEPLNVRVPPPVLLRTRVDEVCCAGHHLGVELLGRAHA